MILTDTARSLLQAPLGVENAVVRLDESLWLYVWIMANANAHGIVCRTSTTVAQALAVSEGTILDWVERLRRSGLITGGSPPPYLVMKLAFWPGRTLSLNEKSSVSGGSGSAAVAGSLQTAAEQQQAANNSSVSRPAGSGDRGAGEGARLLAEAAAVLGENATAGIRDLLSQYPAGLVRRALVRVRETPTGQIRKSRLALFRYLLIKFANESRHEPS